MTLGFKSGFGSEIGKKSVHNFMMGTKRGSIQTQAQLADIAYKQGAERPEAFGTFQKVDPLSSERIVVYKDNKNKRINIGLRGTANLTDVGTDITAVVGGRRESNPYFQEAERTLKQAREQNPGYGITVAGHSLGGSVARYLAERNPDIRAYGYNPGSSIQDAFKQNPENFYSFRNKTDIVSVLDNPSNPRGEFYDVANLLKAHGIGTFTARK